MLFKKKITNVLPVCYHNNLSIAGNCRVYIVELKNSMKPIVSCATNVNATLLNYFLNNPFGFLLFFVLKIWFITKTVYIHCTRGVRFSIEVVAVENLNMFGSRNEKEFQSYLDNGFLSELSRETINLCPVGSFTKKNFKKKKLSNKIELRLQEYVSCIFQSGRQIPILPTYNFMNEVRIDSDIQEITINLSRLANYKRRFSLSSKYISDIKKCQEILRDWKRLRDYCVRKITPGFEVSLDI